MSDLLDRAISAHGGAGRWTDVDHIEARFSSGGLAFAMKGKPGALRNLTGTVAATEPRAVLEPYPRPGFRGVFEPERVRILAADDCSVARERVSPRAAFRGPRHVLWWDHLDLLYFAGYALWHYLTAPFSLLLPGVDTREIDPGPEGERRLEVRFPPELPAHSKDQTYWFDQGGLLRRIDYTAEVFGSWAKAAHLIDGFREMDGLMVGNRRRVVPRTGSGRPRRGPTLVWIDFEDVRAAPR